MTNKKENSETIIKKKKRVQIHGEVFTPQWIIDKMLNTPEIKEACENLTTTFLEPAAGEGAFLMTILIRKLEIVSCQYNEGIRQYEHFSLLALTTLYGIELLPDNVKQCQINLYQIYLQYYIRANNKHNNKLLNEDTLKSAKFIIGLNIRQGNFLTKLTINKEPIVLSEWKVLSDLDKKKVLVIRTEYTLEEIQEQVIKIEGSVYKYSKKQLVFKDALNLEEIKELGVKYKACSIKKVYEEAKQSYNKEEL